MALSATVYTVDVELSDVDRGVYESFTLRLARQPSETAEYMLTRLLAYCLEYGEGIALSEGVAAVDEPAVMIKDLTGRLRAWIEIGKPDPARLHRGMKLAGRAAVYTHRHVPLVLQTLAKERVHRAAEIPVYELAPAFVEKAAAALARRSKVSLSITERQLYLAIDGTSFETALVEHRIPAA